MIEKLDLPDYEKFEAKDWEIEEKINEIIGKMETFEANLLSMSRILEGLLNRQGKDNRQLGDAGHNSQESRTLHGEQLSQKSQPAVCECGHYKDTHQNNKRCSPLPSPNCKCEGFKERGEA